VLKIKYYPVFLLVFASKLAHAAAIWETPDTFDYRYRPLVSLARQASDGKIWLLTGKNQFKAYGVIHIERIDPATGEVLNKTQMLETTNNSIVNPDGFVFDSVGGAFINGWHLDAALQRRELGGQITYPLPQGRWLQDAYNATTPQPTTIRGPGVFDRIPALGTQVATRSVVSHPEFGIWSVTRSNSNIASLTPIDILNGAPGNQVDLESTCQGEIEILSTTRAISRAFTRNCLFDLQTGAVVADLGINWRNKRLATSPKIALSGAFVGVDFMLSATDTQSGATLWTNNVQASWARIVGDTVVTLVEQKIVALNANTGSQVFEFLRPTTYGNGINVSEGGILLNRGNVVELYSLQNGTLLRTITPSEIDAVPEYVLTTYANGAVYSAAVFEENGTEVSQISKRDSITGELQWRKTLTNQVPVFPVIGTTDVLPGLDFRVAANTLLLSWGHTRRKETRSTLISITADTGELNFRTHDIWVGNLNSPPSGTGTLNYGSLTGLGNVKLFKRENLTGMPLATLESRLLTPRGELIRNFEGYSLPDGDFVLWDANTIRRIREADGQVLWSAQNPVFSTTMTMFITPQEMIIAARLPWTIGGNLPTFRRINLATGSHFDTSYSFPEGYSTATASRLNSITASGTPYLTANGTPPFFTFDSNIGLPALLTFATLPMPVQPSYAALPALQFFPLPVGRQRGWVFNAFTGRQSNLFVWVAEPSQDFLSLTTWSGNGMPLSASTSRQLHNQFLEKRTDPVYAIDQVFDGNKYTFVMRKSTPRVSTPQASLRLSEVPQSPERLGHHSLRVSNTGSVDVRRAQLMSMNADSVRFTCSVINGSCAQASGEGTMYLELDLKAGATANIELFDNDFNRGNGVVLMSPLDSPEDDISDNVIDFDRVYFRDGFEP
jgi:hypothetical protein